MFVHRPWDAPLEVLKAAGVTLGVTYPHRIMTTDLQTLRTRNINAIHNVLLAHPNAWDAGGYDFVNVPPGAMVAGGERQVRIFTKPELRGLESAPGKGVRGAKKGVDKAAKKRLVVRSRKST